MGRLGLSDPCLQNFATGSPLVVKLLKISGAVAGLFSTPVASLPPPPSACKRGGGGLASPNPAAKNSPGVPPFGPKLLNFVLGPLHESPCKVVPDQWGDSSVGGCCMVGVGEGGVF